VFAPNVAGSDRGDEAETLSLHTHWGGLDLRDAADVVEWIQRRYAKASVAPPPIGLIGMSAGAYVATALLLYNPGAFACAGIERGLLDLPSKYLATDDPQISPPQFGFYSDARAREDSLLAQIEQRGHELPPLLFLQGNDDYRTPVEQSWAVFNGLRLLPPPGGKASKTPHERHSFVGANHMVGFTGSPEDRCNYYWTMLAFMRNHLTRAPQGLPELSPDELRAALTGAPPRTPPPWTASIGGASTRRLTPMMYPTPRRGSRVTPG